MRRILLLLIVVLSVSGCYKTVYMNVQGDKTPAKMTLEQLEKVPDFDETDWFHYFIYGLVPSEKTIDAGKLCGGSENILSINTKQSFLQALVTEIASYYINIYSPYSAYVVCDKTKMAQKLDPKVLNAKPAPAPPQ
jgi:hypothetical protein